MGLKFEPLGKYIRLVDERNTDMITESVLGINIDKNFMPSVANVIGTDLSKYKLLRKDRFACNPMHVGRDGRLPVSRYTEDFPAIVSPAYFMFEIIDETEISPEYLMLCFRRPDFDHMCWFRTDASVRGGVTWEDVCELTIPVPSIDQQRKIVYDYQVISDRIVLLRKLNEKLSAMGICFLQSLKAKDESKGCKWEEQTVGYWVSLGYIDSPVDGNHGEVHPKASDYVSSGVPFVMANNLIDGFVDYSSCAFITEKQTNTLRKGFSKPRDVLLTHKATIGRKAIVSREYDTTILTPQVTYYRVKKNISPDFLKYYFETSGFQQALKSFADAGSTRAYIGITEQLKLPVVLPPKNTLELLTSVLRRIEVLRQSNYLEIQRLKRLQILVANIT